ncbi:MAG: PIN/TRAM domain-containing protein, partial [Acidimicrobiales bacterium]
MFVEIVRLLIVVLATAIGYRVSGSSEASPNAANIGLLMGASVGYVLGGVIGRFMIRATGLLENQMSSVSAPEMLLGFFGAGIAGLMGAIPGFFLVYVLPSYWGWPLMGLSIWIAGYMGFRLAAARSRELLDLAGFAPKGLASARRYGDAPSAQEILLVDTSAIMDGRITGVLEAGFLRGDLVVPRFVLEELQGIADAQDQNRRRRGQNGLEYLRLLGDHPAVRLHIVEDEVPGFHEVDAKLVSLAKDLGATLFTADKPLAQIAELQGVPTVSLHLLASSLQPQASPGDEIQLTIERAGKEPGQGIAFLSDGSMVVVSEAAHLVDQRVSMRIVTTTRTSVGHMFFATITAGPDPTQAEVSER